MDNCFVDVTVEFLCIAFHNILYYTSIYPKSIFESRKKFNLVVYRSIHPEIQQYIDLCLKHIEECLKSLQLGCVEFAITDKEYNPILKFMFQFDTNNYFDETTDAYLIQSEQSLRAFCLKLASVSSNFKDLPEDATFSIFIHTNESTAVAAAANSEFESFPFVEVEELNYKKMEEETSKIIPLRRFTIRSQIIDSYIEFGLQLDMLSSFVLRLRITQRVLQMMQCNISSTSAEKMADYLVYLRSTQIATKNDE